MIAIEVINGVVPVVMLAVGFIAGMKVADRYRREEDARRRYDLQHQYDRIKAGVDADDPLQPYTPPQVIPVNFNRRGFIRRKVG